MAKTSSNVSHVAELKFSQDAKITTRKDSVAMHGCDQQLTGSTVYRPTTNKHTQTFADETQSRGQPTAGMRDWEQER